MFAATGATELIVLKMSGNVGLNFFAVLSKTNGFCHEQKP
jgi:hypothetical protein